MGLLKSKIALFFSIFLVLAVLSACQKSHSQFTSASQDSVDPDMGVDAGLPDLFYSQENGNGNMLGADVLAPPSTQVKSSVSDENPQEYRLKSGDKIEVSVWGEDMTKTLLVQPDGRISYPLVGSLYVSGKTFSEVVSIMEAKLSEYIYDPKVTIIGTSFEGNVVSIVGAVQKPGRVVVGEGYRVLDVLTAAGGLRYSESTLTDTGGEMANLSKAYLSRNGKVMPVDFGALIYDGDMRYNINVEIGDFIYIPSSASEGIYITGEVVSPKVIPYRGKPNIVQVLTAAGGGNKKGHMDSVAIVRGSLGNPQVQIVDVTAILAGKAPNVYLQSGDIVHVPETFLSKVERISDQITPFLDLITEGDRAVKVIKGF